MCFQGITKTQEREKESERKKEKDNKHCRKLGIRKVIGKLWRGRKREVIVIKGNSSKRTTSDGVEAMVEIMKSLLGRLTFALILRLIEVCDWLFLISYHPFFLGAFPRQSGSCLVGFSYLFFATWIMLILFLNVDGEGSDEGVEGDQTY